MKKTLYFSTLIASSMLLSSCDFTRGAYKEGIVGVVVNEDYVTRYMTDSKGYLVSMEIDKIYPMNNSLENINFDYSLLDTVAGTAISSVVPSANVDLCHYIVEEPTVYTNVDELPKFIRVNDQHYYFNDSPEVCSYETYSITETQATLENTALSPLDLTESKIAFRKLDFTINPYEENVYIEDFRFGDHDGDAGATTPDRWYRVPIKQLPMSHNQNGLVYDIESSPSTSLIDESSNTFDEQLSFITNYFVRFQEIDSLVPKATDYETDPELGNTTVWEDETYTSLRELNSKGVDMNNLIIKVNIKATELEKIFETLSVTARKAGPF